jgi:hypothetical protein
MQSASQQDTLLQQEMLRWDEGPPAHCQHFVACRVTALYRLFKKCS